MKIINFMIFITSRRDKVFLWVLNIYAEQSWPVFSVKTQISSIYSNKSSLKFKDFKQFLFRFIKKYLFFFDVLETNHSWLLTDFKIQNVQK